MTTRHCETCTCGRTLLSWSDREYYVDLNDLVEVTEAVLSCAFDHSYDSSIVPYGIGEHLRGPLLEVVSQYMASIAPDWREKTHWATDDQRAELRRRVLECLCLERQPKKMLITVTRSVAPGITFDEEKVE